MKQYIYIQVVYFFLCINVYSQNNYWSQQYGAQSSMLGGAVVAGVRDNSAMYYNPGALGFIEHPTLTINANVYQLDYVNLKNGAGPGIDMNSIRPVIYPQLVSGLITFKKVSRLKMAYGLLTRYRNDLKTYAKNQGYFELVPSSGGADFFKGNTNYELNNIAQWGGLSLSYKLSDKVSLGFTKFINYTHIDERITNNTSIDVNEPGNLYTSSIFESSVSVIDAISMNWKLGAAFDFNKFKLGVSGTIPSVDLFGFARLERELEYYNQDRFLPDSLLLGKAPVFILSEQQRGLSARFRNPGSLALGLELNLPKSSTRLMITAEYFFSVADYTVARYDSLTPVRPFGSYQNVAIPDFLVEKTFNVGVLNLGIGLDQKINEKWQFYFGARTDLNNTQDILGNRPLAVNNLNATFWHFLHFSSGVKFRRGSSDLTIGLNYGLGITNIRRQPFNLAEPDVVMYENTLLSFMGTRKNEMKTNVHSVGLILGYTYYIQR
ncbi:MAG: hypothetical protein N2167_00860 [Flavobacteriales bacterium]|nr:hypothetical protein [Flavobacteriales bacterium]